MVVIRLSRRGRVHRPSYTIVAMDSRQSRNGGAIERLGKYDPAMPVGKTLSGVKTEAIKVWLAKGARISDTVRTQLLNNKIQL